MQKGVYLFKTRKKLSIILEGFTTKYSRREPGEYKRMAAMLDRIFETTPLIAGYFA